MKIKVEQIVDLMTPRTVVHVGASTGAEVDYYLKSGVEVLHLIEPLPSVHSSLIEKWGDDPRITIWHCACLDKTCDIEFHVAANQGMSSSIHGVPNLDMHNCEFIDKIIVQAKPLDDLVGDLEIDLLVVDAQGSEDRVFSGASRALANTKYVFTEASMTPLYDGACTFDDVNALLSNRFDLVGTFFNSRGTGDALFKWKE
jgi:FkbM family methyltransferase